MSIEIELIEERQLGPQETALQELLAAVFPEHLNKRVYFKQLPTFRFLAKHEEKIIGQVGVVHRAVRLGDDTAKIFGIVDLAVEKSLRNRGIARSLLAKVESLAKDCLIDFIVLFADDHRLYRACGYNLKTNECVWLKIDEHKSLGIGKEKMADCLMVKETGKKPWNEEAQLDLLGYMF